MARFAGSIMGTTYRVSLSELPAGVDAEQLSQGALRSMQRIDALLSSYRPDSDISRFNRAEEGKVPVDPITANLALHSISVSALTKGTFDITIGPLVNIWGFGPMGEMFVDVPDSTAVNHARSWVNYRSLFVDLPSSALRRKGSVTLDVSGIAKGYAVDHVARYLDGQGISGYLIEIGGELLARGRKPNGQPWRVGIERPGDGFGSVQQPITLPEGGAVATSGDYRNFRMIDGRRYAHIIDPRSGWPTRHGLASVTVVHPESCTDADALATALAVMGPEPGMRFAEQQGLAAFFIIREDAGSYRVEHSAAFAAYLDP